MDEEEHSPSEFYYPDEVTHPNVSFRNDNEEPETTEIPIIVRNKLMNF